MEIIDLVVPNVFVGKVKIDGKVIKVNYQEKVSDKTKETTNDKVEKEGNLELKIKNTKENVEKLDIPEAIKHSFLNRNKVYFYTLKK